MTAAKDKLLERLKLQDPFKGFGADSNSKLWGWNGDSNIFPELVSQLRPELIIEVGSWMGLSACNMANSTKQLGLDSVVVCVDTWLGSKEHWMDLELRKHLELKNGYPTFFNRFLSNVQNLELSDRVLPLPLPSQIAGSLLKDMGVTSKMIYIDGSHDEKDVYDDLAAYWPLVEQDGVIFGDDWEWSSVANAVKAFSAEMGIPYSVFGINWVFRK